MTSKKDYRLTSAERIFVEQNIPSTQKRTHISFHADIHCGKKKFSNSIISLTEHYILPIVKGILSGMKVPQLYHIKNINEINVEKENEVEILFHNKLPSLKIHSPAVVHFVRSLIRNYVLSFPLLPPHKRFIFHSYDMSLFPPFKPRMSPSQLFQLQYNAECSYLKTNYFHNVILYYYTLLYYGNPIFNANDLPVFLTDPKFGVSFSLDPIVNALAYCPFTHIFTANSIKSPNLISCAARLATSNKSCKAIRIRNCGCTAGGKAFLDEFTKTDHDYPIYYDFSGNKLNDFTDLFKAFQLITAPVETLNFEDCGMNEQSILALFDAINENENLWEIEELLIAGNYLNEHCCGMLIKLLNEFQKSEIFNFVTLSFGPAERSDKLLMMVDCCNQPFKHLRFYGIKITPDSTYDLCRFFKRTTTLKNIEFIDCDFEEGNLQQILHDLAENKYITHLNLNLSGCKISGTKFSIFIKEVSNGLGSKLHSLTLDRNKLSFDDLVMLNNASPRFPVLSSLSLNGNFNSTSGMNSQIARILNFPKLESLSLNGLGISTLKNDSSQLLSELKSNTQIKHIDISKNLIGESGYKQIAELIKINNSLLTVKFSSSEMKSSKNVLEILDAVSHNKSLCNTCIFREDISRILSGQPPQVIFQYSQLLLKALSRNMENCAVIDAVPGEFELAQTSLSTLTSSSVIKILQSKGGAGIGGGGASTGGPSIDEQDMFLAGILDDSVYELSKMLKIVRPTKNQHLKMIENIFGIPLPFQPDEKTILPILSTDLDNFRDGLMKNDSNSNSNPKSDEYIGGNAKVYVDPSLFGLVVDNSKANPSEDTLLCKSLLNRRPDLAFELEGYKPSKILVQPSMKYKEEDQESEEKVEEKEENRVQINVQINAHQNENQKPVTRRRQTVRPDHIAKPPKPEDLLEQEENGENELEELHDHNEKVIENQEE